MKGSQILKTMLALAMVLVSLGTRAVTLTGQQTAPMEWIYTLTFAPLDNYSIFQPNTTITLAGLFGVTGAARPTSTDFSTPHIDQINLEWIPEVLNGGTEVRWTHFGPGTGNFNTEQHVFGFRVFANGATDGLISLTTSGFSRDVGRALPDGSFNLDITGLVAGPVAVPEPETIALFIFGIAGLAILKRRALTRQRSMRWSQQPSRAVGSVNELGLEIYQLHRNQPL